MLIKAPQAVDAKDWRQEGYGFLRTGKGEVLESSRFDLAGIGTLIAWAVFVDFSSDLKRIEIISSERDYAYVFS